MRRLFSLSVSLLLFFSIFGLMAVLSDDCVPIIVSRDNLNVGDTFTVYPIDTEIVSHVSIGSVDLVGIEGNHKVYRAKSSGTIVFRNCNEIFTLKIFPKETPLDVLINMFGIGRK